MAEYRTVKMSFWTDPYVEGLTAEGKLLYLYLFTCPYTNNLGVLETTTRRIAYETGLDAGEVKDLLGDMEQSGKVAIDGNCILLKHFIRHQCSTSPKIIASLQALFGSISSNVVRDALCRHYPKIFNAENMVSIPYEYHSDSVGIPSWEREFKGESEDEGLKDTNVSLPETLVSDESGAPLCPQNAMLALYHEVLPELPRIRTLRKPLQEQVRTRWREKYDEGKFSTTAEGLEYFRGFFAYVKNCSFLMGKNKTSWTCDYRWIMKAEHFDKITEGKYEDRA